MVVVRKGSVTLPGVLPILDPRTVFFGKFHNVCDVIPKGVHWCVRFFFVIVLQIFLIMSPH